MGTVILIIHPQVKIRILHTSYIKSLVLWAFIADIFFKILYERNRIV